MLPSTIVAFLLINSIWAYTDDSYQLSDNSDLGYLYPDDLPEDGGDYEMRKRSNSNFMRFGRGGGNTYDEYEDYNEDFARPTRSGKIEKNDHFIRFGRSKQNYIRFGRDSHRVQRANHLRFGRSVEEVTDKVRNKRDTTSAEGDKRADSNFLRFGRPNSNYMRFGRANSNYMRFGRANSNYMRFGRTSEAPDLQPSAEYDDARHEATELAEKLRRLPSDQLSGVLAQLFGDVRRNQAV